MTGSLDFQTLADLAGHRPGITDAPCPICGPDRRAKANQKRRVLRIWIEPGFASFHCARCGATGWARQDGAKTVPPADLARRRADVEKREAERRERVAEKAMRIWASARHASGDHPYLLAKGVPPVGEIGQHGDRLVIPMQHPARLTGIQFIGPDGGKRFLKDSILTGSYTILGDPALAGRLVVAEGYATAASAHVATGIPAAVCFAASNLMPVAETLRRFFPDADFIFAADDDEPGIRAASDAARATGGSVTKEAATWAAT